MTLELREKEPFLTYFEPKRRHPRRNIAVRVKVRDMNSQAYEKGRTKDISISGICLKCRLPFDKGDMVEVALDDDFSGEHYTAVAEIKRIGKVYPYLDGHITDKMYEYGLQYWRKNPL